MNKTIGIVNKRGHLEIPLSMWKESGIKPLEKVLFHSENGRIVIEKLEVKKKIEALMKEYYSKYADLESEVAREWENVSAEADRKLDDA